MKAIDVIVSDPWNFGTEHGCGPFHSEIIAQSPNALLLRLLQPLVYHGQVCEYFVSVARHSSSSPLMQSEHDSVHVNLTRIEPDQVNSETPFDLSSWRGGIVLTGTIKKT